MNICLFTPTFLPRIGGVEIVINKLAETLVRKGHKVVVLAPYICSSTTETEKSYSIVRYRLPTRGSTIYGSNRYKLDEISRILAFLKAHYKYKFDVIHLHTAYPNGITCVLIQSFFKIPFVVTAHAIDIQKIPEINYGMRLDKKIEKQIQFVLKKSSAITAISSSVKKDVLSLVDDNGMIFDVPNGTNIDRFSNPVVNIRDICNILEEGKIILSVGRNHIKKGYSYLIKAMKYVCQEVDDAYCVIIGRDTEELYPLIVELQLEKHVVFLREIAARKDGKDNEIPSKELISCYLTSNIFVSPAIIEGFSLVSLEASASGLPLVMTDISGNKDIVREGQNGFLVPARDPKALADKIILLLKDERLRRRLGKTAREISKRYDWENVTDKYLDVYEEVIARRKCVGITK